MDIEKFKNRGQITDSSNISGNCDLTPVFLKLLCNRKMKHIYIYRGIGILEIVTGLLGAGLVLFALVKSQISFSSNFATVLAIIVLGAFFVLAGALLFKGSEKGIWFSVVAQIIAIFSYTSGGSTLGFNNVFRFFVHYTYDGATFGFDVIAIVLVFYLAFTAP